MHRSSFICPLTSNPRSNATGRVLRSVGIHFDRAFPGDVEFGQGSEFLRDQFACR